MAYWLICKSFEVTIGIIAACIPALRPGYKWFLDRLARTRRTPSDQMPFVDSPERGLKGDIPVAVPPKVHSMDTIESFRIDTGSTQASPYDQITKTTQVDAEKDAMRNNERNNGKPSLEIDLGPSFEIDRSLWSQSWARSSITLRTRSDERLKYERIGEFF